MEGAVVLDLDQSRMHPVGSVWFETSQTILLIDPFQVIFAFKVSQKRSQMFRFNFGTQSEEMDSVAKFSWLGWHIFVVGGQGGRLWL